MVGSYLSCVGSAIFAAMFADWLIVLIQILISGCEVRPVLSFVNQMNIPGVHSTRDSTEVIALTGSGNTASLLFGLGAHS